MTTTGAEPRAPAGETTTRRRLARDAGRLGREAAGTYIGTLFAEHGRMVLGLCRLLLRDPVEAEDAAQQVFVSAHEAILRGPPPRDRAAWMAAIARNECRARIRARMRDPLTLPELPSDFPDPLAAAIRAADLRAVWAALAVLPRRQRNALVLRELGGLSYDDVGRALGVSHSAVESLLFRARHQIRSIVAGANAAAAPVALRDQLAQLIPGFDPASAGFVARAAALPLTLKVAGAAVGVGVVAAGAGALHGQTPMHGLQPAHLAHNAPFLAVRPIQREAQAGVARVESVRAAIRARRVPPRTAPTTHREAARDHREPDPGREPAAGSVSSRPTERAEEQEIEAPDRSGGGRDGQSEHKDQESSGSSSDSSGHSGPD